MRKFNSTPLSVAFVLLGTLAAHGGPGGLQAASKPAPDTYEAHQTAAKAALADFQKLIPKKDGLADADAAHRDAVAPQAIPLMKQVVARLDDMTRARPDLERPILATRLNQEAMLYALGDSDTVAALEKKMKAGGADGASATNVVLRGRWLRAGKDAAKHAEVIRTLDESAAAMPQDVFLSQFIADVRPDVDDPAVRQHLMDLMANTMSNPTSKALVGVMKNADKTKSFESKPLTLAGKQPDGKDFTTADWQGKVILVDFWAVWCAPCRAELPRVKKVYEQYHDKGFEVLGVSNDYKAETVIKFAERDGLPWPQLFDAEAGAGNKWHPLTKQFGINGIPVMFLIDKKGVCRTVSAREDFETLIPKMLAE